MKCGSQSPPRKVKYKKPCHKFWKEILFIMVPEDASHNKV